jgi:hypothetical protein
MKRAVASWLDEPSTYSATILNSFHFLIDGKAKKDIETFIKKKPKERTGTNLKQDCANYLYHRVYRVATAALWRTFHHEGKISPGWCVWGDARPPPFITFTITSKVTVYTSAEWADTLTLFHL